jgi:hypothetical protein
LDEYGDPIPFSSILYGHDLMAASKQNGTFEIRDLEPGTYTLNISASGHIYNDKVSMAVDYNDEKYVEIILQKDVEEPVDTDEFENRTLIIITVIVTLLVLLGIVLFIRWRSTTADED